MITRFKSMTFNEHKVALSHKLIKFKQILLVGFFMCDSLAQIVFLEKIVLGLLKNDFFFILKF